MCSGPALEHGVPEATDAPEDLAETCLVHVACSTVDRAYRQTAA